MKATFAALVVLLSPQLQADTQETPIRTGDMINITVAGVPAEDAQAINHAYPVSDKGVINVPFIENLPAAGLKASELAQKIEAQYVAKGIYTHPAVTVTLVPGGEERVIYVTGDISKPGPIPFRARMTVAKAISIAGADAFRRTSRVKLKRRGQPVLILNLSKADSPDNDITVEPDDEVIVPN